MAAEGYDRVEMTSEAGSVQHLSRAEYEKLPIDKRVHLLMTNRVKFFLGNSPVSPLIALR